MSHRYGETFKTQKVETLIWRCDVCGAEQEDDRVENRVRPFLWAYFRGDRVNLDICQACTPRAAQAVTALSEGKQV